MIAPVIEREAVERGVYFIEELAEVLGVTPKTIRKLERLGAFPIPRLPRLDRKARYSRAQADTWASGGGRLLSTTQASINRIKAKR